MRAQHQQRCCSSSSRRLPRLAPFGSPVEGRKREPASSSTRRRGPGGRLLPSSKVLGRQDSLRCCAAASLACAAALCRRSGHVVVSYTESSRPSQRLGRLGCAVGAGVTDYRMSVRMCLPQTRPGLNKQQCVVWCRERDTRRGMHEGIINKARDSVRRGPEARGRLEGKIRIEGLSVRRRRAPEPFLWETHMPDNHPTHPTPPWRRWKPAEPEPEAGGVLFLFTKWRNGTTAKRLSQATCAIDLWRIRTSTALFPFPPPLQSARRECELDGCGPVVLVFEVRRRGAPEWRPAVLA